MPGVLVLNAVAATARASRRFRSERLLSEKQRNEDERSRKRRFDGRREATCAAGLGWIHERVRSQRAADESGRHGGT